MILAIPCSIIHALRIDLFYLAFNPLKKNMKKFGWLGRPSFFSQYFVFFPFQFRPPETRTVSVQPPQHRQLVYFAGWGHILQAAFVPTKKGRLEWAAFFASGAELRLGKPLPSGTQNHVMCGLIACTRIDGDSAVPGLIGGSGKHIHLGVGRDSKTIAAENTRRRNGHRVGYVAGIGKNNMPFGFNVGRPTVYSDVVQENDHLARSLRTLACNRLWG